MKSNFIGNRRLVANPPDNLVLTALYKSVHRFGLLLLLLPGLDSLLDHLHQFGKSVELGLLQHALLAQVLVQNDVSMPQKVQDN